MHAYDADKVAGHTLIVRRAEDGEKLVTLDGKERELTSAMITMVMPKRLPVLAVLWADF